MTFADRVEVMNGGRIEEIDRPRASANEVRTKV
jgi:ABC-type sugar transport system ATPase subunit